jgi:hypothetical protein
VRSEGVVAESLERSYQSAVGFFFGNTELDLDNVCGNIGI